MPADIRDRDVDARGGFDPRFDNRSPSGSDRRPAGSPVPARQDTADTPRNSSGGPDKRVRKLSEIKSRLLRPALTSHYICKFTPPQSVKNWTAEKQTAFTTDNQQLIELSCAEAALPGSSLMTHDITNDFSGVSEKHVYRRAYDQVASFTFMVDHDYTIIKIFENWMSYIVGEQFTSSGGRPGIEDKNYFYRVKYPEQYQTDNLYITKFEREYQDTGACLEYRFLKSFPLSIVTMPISYAESQLLKCTVNFAYTRYVIDSTKTQKRQETRGAQTQTGALDLTRPYRGTRSNDTEINFPTNTIIPPVINA